MIRVNFIRDTAEELETVMRPRATAESTVQAKDTSREAPGYSPLVK